MAKGMDSKLVPLTKKLRMGTAKPSEMKVGGAPTGGYKKGGKVTKPMTKKKK